MNNYFSKFKIIHDDNNITKFNQAFGYNNNNNEKNNENIKVKKRNNSLKENFKIIPNNFKNNTFNNIVDSKEEINFDYNKTNIFDDKKKSNFKFKIKNLSHKKLLLNKYQIVAHKTINPKIKEKFIININNNINNNIQIHMNHNNNNNCFLDKYL